MLQELYYNGYFYNPLNLSKLQHENFCAEDKNYGIYGKYPLRTNIALDNTNRVHVSHFRYLTCDITYDVDYDLIIS